MEIHGSVSLSLSATLPVSVGRVQQRRTTTVSDRGKRLAHVIKADLTDVTGSPSKITFVLWQIYELTLIFLLFFLSTPPRFLTLLIQLTNRDGFTGGKEKLMDDKLEPRGNIINCDRPLLSGG